MGDVAAASALPGASASALPASGGASATSASAPAAVIPAGAVSMSLIRALDEVVLLDKRIAKKVSECTFLGVLSKKSRGGIVSNPEEFSHSAKADWQSVTDLIARRQRIKSAIILSNATTRVRVAGESLTVAEVIERKKSLALQRDLLQKLKSQREQSLRSLEQQNSAMEAELQKLLEIHFGKGGNSKTQASDIEDISRPFRENNQAKLLDPIGVDAKIRDIEAYIEEFERETKFTLSESNAMTKIYVV